MPLKRTPPSSPALNDFASPLQYSQSETNITEVGKEAGVSAASSSSSLGIATRISKRKREEITKDDLMDMFSALQKQQDAKLDLIINSVNEVKLSVDSINEKYDAVVQRLIIVEEENKNHLANIQLLENKIESLERYARCASVEIRNIPQDAKESKEDLKNIIKKTAETIKVVVESADIKDVRRINTRATNKPIIADFVTVTARDIFLTGFKKYNKEHQTHKLNTASLGLSGPANTVYISDNLTPNERKLYHLTREFAKKNEYKFCWSAYGKIFLRKTEGDKHIRINKEEDLNKLIETITT